MSIWGPEQRRQGWTCLVANLEWVGNVYICIRIHIYIYILIFIYTYLKIIYIYIHMYLLYLHLNLLDDTPEKMIYEKIILEYLRHV